MLKQIRSNLMQIMMMTTLLLTIIGIDSNKKQLLSQISRIFNDFPWLLGVVVFIIIFTLSKIYYQQEDFKKEEQENKLKKELTNYYQSLSKNIVEQIVQTFNYTLEQESKKIQTALKEVQKYYEDYLVSIQQQQLKTKQDIDLLKKEQQNIQKDRKQLGKTYSPL
jgi:uncharacterized membrane protein (DUF485 family)